MAKLKLVILLKSPHREDKGKKLYVKIVRLPMQSFSLRRLPIRTGSDPLRPRPGGEGPAPAYPSS